MLESILGFTLSLVLLVGAFRAADSDLGISNGRVPPLQVGAVIILCTEVMSVACEGTNIRRKVHEGHKELSERQRWRSVLNWLAFLSDIVPVVYHLRRLPPLEGFELYNLRNARIALLSITLLLALPSGGL